jgi:integrase
MAATVWKDTDGRWRLDYTDANGKRKRVRLPVGTTKESARAILAQRVGEVQRANFLGVHSVESLKHKTFWDFVEKEYLPSCQVRNTPETYLSKTGLADRLKPIFGHMPLRTITVADIEKFADREAGRKKKNGDVVRPATVNRKLLFLSSVFKAAIKRGHADTNPVRMVTKLKEDNFKLRFFTPSEEERFTRFLPYWLRPIVTFALNTGARISEILRLTWADVDFEQQLVRFTLTKNHKTRWVPLNPILMGLLEQIKPPVETWETSPYVFAHKNGKPFKKSGASHSFKNALVEAGIFDASFHTLRHTFGSRLAQAGIPLNTIRELLGHGSMGVTLRYAHLAASDLRGAVAILGKVGTPLAQPEAKTAQAR